MTKEKINIEVAKVRSNVIFGCGTCNHQWYQDDYHNEQKYHDGEECPSCASRETFPV